MSPVLKGWRGLGWIFGRFSSLVAGAEAVKGYVRTAPLEHAARKAATVAQAPELAKVVFDAAAGVAAPPTCRRGGGPDGPSGMGLYDQAAGRAPEGGDHHRGAAAAGGRVGAQPEPTRLSWYLPREFVHGGW